MSVHYSTSCRGVEHAVQPHIPL